MSEWGSGFREAKCRFGGGSGGKQGSREAWRCMDVMDGCHGSSNQTNEVVRRFAGSEDMLSVCRMSDQDWGGLYSDERRATYYD